MKVEKWIYFVLVFTLLFLIFFRPILGSKIRNFLDGGAQDQNDNGLVFENQNLKTEIVLLKEIVERTPRKIDENYELGFVYARYPFNIKSEVLINAGNKQSILAGKPVVFGAYGLGEIGQTALFGIVSEVFKETSLVSTIFSKDWRSEVKIGEKQAMAVLEGGSIPKLRLINKDAAVLEGDVVYNADGRFPFGLPVGYIKDTRTSSDSLFKEAELNVPYDLSQVGLVFVIK